MLTFRAESSPTELAARLQILRHVSPHCDLFPSVSHWGILLLYFLEPPASILICTVKYAGCDLIPYIPVQIRAVSVQDYPDNSCNAASPQLISPWMSAESRVILPKLQCTPHLLTFSQPHNLFGMQNTWRGFSDLTVCRAFIMAIQPERLGRGAVFPFRRELLNANSGFVIIGQSSWSRRSNHRCHLASLLMLWCHSEDVTMGTFKTRQG